MDIPIGVATPEHSLLAWYSLQISLYVFLHQLQHKLRHMGLADCAIET